MDEIFLAFIEDAVDLISTMESGLLQMEQGECDPQTINSIFRAAHTLKGDAGVVELTQVATFAHLLEDTLALLRSDKITVNRTLVSLLLRGCDHIKALINLAAAQAQDPAQNKDQVQNKAIEQAGQAIDAALRAHVTWQQVFKPTPAAEVSPLVQEKEALASSIRQEQVAVGKQVQARQVRVPAEKLDQLLDLVGELVSSSVAAHLKAKKSRQAELIEANSGLLQLVESMRELSKELRMVRVGEVFNRFRRVVRDLAQEMGRDVALVISGEDAELDKSVVEKIGDPLMHLLRNAIDHGIESPAVRRACGKPERGTIALNAYHESDGIVIEVSDDGAGLDRDLIFAKAVERGLVHATQTLSEREILELIFLPGFSTVSTVSSVSGRGVGMDVVRSNINALRGSVEVQTERGKGSKFICRLPLTMAMVEGFLVAVGKTCYVIALELVLECAALPRNADTSDYFDLRGHALPLLRLRDHFGIQGSQVTKEYVVVVRFGGTMAGIVVDQLQGEQQTVIKRLPSVFQNLSGISGSTILGTGAVGLILDVPSLIAAAHHHKKT